MKKLTVLIALAASVFATASMDTNGSREQSDSITLARDVRTCRALVQKMERSASSNSWLNRVRTWKCRDDLSPDAAATASIPEAAR